MTKKNQIEENQEDVPVIYMHIYHDAALFLMTDDGTIYENADLSHLKKEVARMENEQGVVRYSIDEHGELTTEAQEITEHFAKSNAHFEAVDKPHPAVYGYHRSFVEYIYDAVEVAEMDLEGLEGKIKVDQDLLKTLSSGTEEHTETEGQIKEYESQIEFAKYALKRLKELELDLCSETENTEH